jgi:hypothetical protein
MSAFLLLDTENTEVLGRIYAINHLDKQFEDTNGLVMRKWCSSLEQYLLDNPNVTAGYSLPDNYERI